MVDHGTIGDRYGETFLPKHRVIFERMWLSISSKPTFVSKSIDELVQMVRPIFICQSKDMKVLSEDPNEAVFEEQDNFCYGRGYRHTIARIVKGKSTVSVYLYRADVKELPEGRRDFVLKTMTSAPLDKAPLPTQSVAANSAPSAAASP